MIRSNSLQPFAVCGRLSQNIGPSVMPELFAFLVVVLVGACVIGPWIAIMVQSSRSRRLELEIARIKRDVHSLLNGPPPRSKPPVRQQQSTLSTITERVSKAREDSGKAGDSIDLELPTPQSNPTEGIASAQITDARSTGSSTEDTDGPAESISIEKSQPLDSDVWTELPIPPQTPSTPEQAENRTELMVVRAMTWIGVVTLVLGVGFLYRYALAQGWISDTSRVVGGIIAGSLGFVAAVQCRRKDYVFFGDCVAAASSGVIKLSIYAASVWYGMFSTSMGFRGFLIGGTVLWAYSVFYRSRLAASLATVAALLTPALLSDYVGPTANADANLFAGYLFAVNLTVAAVTWMRAWRVPAGIATVGTGLHLTAWYANAFTPNQMAIALGWLAGFTILFVAHWLVATLKTQAEHPLDGPILVAGASFLSIAMIGVTHEASYLIRASTPTAVAALYLVLWLTVGNRLAGRLPSVLGAATALLVAVAVPLWLSPAWSLATWAALAWIWGRLAIRDDRPITAAIAVVLFGCVQLLAFAIALSTVLRPDAIPLPVWNWTVSGSLLGQLEGLFKTVPVNDVGPLGLIFHARSLSLLACGLSAAAMTFEVSRKDSLSRIGISPASLKSSLGALATVNLAGISLAELMHTAVRGNWFASTTITVWLLHFATLAGLAVLWSSRKSDHPERSGVAKSLLAITIATALTATLAVVFEAMTQRSSDVLTPVVNLRSAMMLISGVIVWLAAALVSRPGEVSGEPTLSRHTAIRGIGIACLWVISEAVQFGKWAGMSAEEVSALLTAILGIAGVIVLAIGFIRLEVGLRRAGLILLGLATAKIYLIDIWTASSEVRTVAFLILGATLLGAAFLYRSYRDQFKEWLGDTNNVLH